MLEIGTRVIVIDHPNFTHIREYIGIETTIVSMEFFSGKPYYGLKGVAKKRKFSRPALKKVDPQGSWDSIEEICNWNPHKERVT